ncbi:hypothetical protein RRF68_10950 [Tenacibaculum sp. HL-MS23]|uniref:hypothetical protein n=1 Tax=Tenacibaculum sp. HL-MS23 TaxID=3077734 RepID=UPI0028FC315F|nr:hypothetical protein [Tenacibaculum sp. HL-MS23]WNW01502.1 hypothetical protein RRF68_10950 [Tenacibaculum sp. HL-MS23]
MKIKKGIKNNIIDKLLILLIIFICGNVISQEKKTDNYNEWIETSFKDEFGDNTGRKARVYLTKGKFGNSATTNSNLTVRITEYKKYFHISLFEYDSPPEAILYGGEYNFVLVSFKDKKGNITRKGVPFLKTGGLRIKKEIN